MSEYERKKAAEIKMKQLAIHSIVMMQSMMSKEEFDAYIDENENMYRTIFGTAGKACENCKMSD